MTNFIAAICLLLQGADGDGPKTKNPGEAHREAERDDSQRRSLEALQKKVEQLEAELNAIKKSPPGAGGEQKTEGEKAAAPNTAPQGQAQGQKPGSQDQEDEKKRKELEEEFKKALGQEKPAPKMTAPVTPQVPMGGGATLKLIDI